MHNYRPNDVREHIKNYKIQFENGIDYIDLKVTDIVGNNFLIDLGYTQMQISQAKNIYLLSERDYMKLIKI